MKVALLAAVTCAGLLSGCCQCQDLDLTGAVIVLPENAQKREKTAATKPATARRSRDF